MNPIWTWGYRYQYTFLRYFIIFSHFLNDNQLCSQLFVQHFIDPPLIKTSLQAGIVSFSEAQKVE